MVKNKLSQAKITIYLFVFERGNKGNNKIIIQIFAFLDYYHYLCGHIWNLQ